MCALLVFAKCYVLCCIVLQFVIIIHANLMNSIIPKPSVRLLFTRHIHYQIKQIYFSLFLIFFLDRLTAFLQNFLDVAPPKSPKDLS